MCLPLLPAAILGSAAIGAGASIYSASKSASAQKQAIAASTAQAEKQAQSAETAFNRANQKQPGIAAMFAANKAGMGKGLGSTFLTGAQGVPNIGKYLGGAPSLLGA